MEDYKINNRTMELKEVRNKWFFDRERKIWCLEDILYTSAARSPKFQRLSIYVPEAYMTAGGVQTKNIFHGYDAATAPVIFANNSAGYMQMPHMWPDGPRYNGEQFLKRGFIFVTPGNRGSDSRDSNGVLCGKAPWNLVDLKTALRFLRHNKAFIPGDLQKIISTGWSAGGAMSCLLAVTGNHPDFVPYLKENGAFMDESDAVYAAQIYCPITDLENADMAYEWMFAADINGDGIHERHAAPFNDFKKALSSRLKSEYISYFNSLGLKETDSGKLLSIGNDGRSGTAYERLMDEIEKAAEKFLKLLSEEKSDLKYSVDDYLSGNYMEEVEVHPGPSGDEKKGHRPPDREGMTMGDMLSRPAEGQMREQHRFQTMMVHGKSKKNWLTYAEGKATICDLDTYVLQYDCRMKDCTSFDGLDENTGENRLFGTENQSEMHFGNGISASLESLKDTFPEEYKKYIGAFTDISRDKELERRIYLMNPLNYIGKAGADAAQYYRIRAGAIDPHTASMVSLLLSFKLAMAEKSTDYALVWDRPHCEADYPEELCDWIEKIVKEQSLK